MEKTLQTFVEAHREKIIEQWFAKSSVISDVDKLNALTTETVNQHNEDFFEVFLSIILESEEQKYKRLQDFSKKMNELNWPLPYLTRGVDHFKDVVLELYLKKGEREKYPEFSRALNKMLDPILLEMTEQYRIHTEEWQKTINVQKLALQELSAPLIPVFDKISVMPLVGTIDTERAKLIMENLLQGVIEHGAQVVLVDITGVPLVDTMVAHHIIQAAEAVRLVGAKCIIVGIRPEIAQTIINLGIDLTDTPTLSTLRKGINTALRLTGRKIVEINQDELGGNNGLRKEG